jgi:hypothetical protein
VARGLGLTRPLGPLAAALAVFAIGFGVSLVGDACHVASGTTRYAEGVAKIALSAWWFPFAVALSVLGAAWAGQRMALPARPRTRLDAAIGIAAVLALYALTAFLRGSPPVVSVTLCGGIAFVVWAWWDASPGALVSALAAAVLGPLAEIGIVAIGAASYAPDASGLLGVAPWLPCLYFAAGAVASGLWRALARTGTVVNR